MKVLVGAPSRHRKYQQKEQLRVHGGDCFRRAIKSCGQSGFKRKAKWIGRCVCSQGIFLTICSQFRREPPQASVLGGETRFLVWDQMEDLCMLGKLRWCQMQAVERPKGNPLKSVLGIFLQVGVGKVCVL